MQEAAGRCPACQRRLTFRQAVAMPARRPFSCRHCAARLEKSSGRWMVGLGGFAFFSLVKMNHGWDAWQTWAAGAAVVVACILDGFLLAKARIAGDKTVGETQSAAR